MTMPQLQIALIMETTSMKAHNISAWDHLQHMLSFCRSNIELVESSMSSQCLSSRRSDQEFVSCELKSITVVCQLADRNQVVGVVTKPLIATLLPHHLRHLEPSSPKDEEANKDGSSIFLRWSSLSMLLANPTNLSTATTSTELEADAAIGQPHQSAQSPQTLSSLEGLLRSLSHLLRYHDQTHERRRAPYTS
ncbi:hypothetical protein SELMODRAFT_426440 [Selaginella moellendorffii]|uniref:Uncharacterized protein n=1 Tax=Selaginella moellendorffii TaxID=88036 RepID=D8SWD2_SELML|nr:hypothetical protein SELMODRAFT_426440 [Selaginella moellendorffii]